MKKQYVDPAMEVVKIETMSVLALSSSVQDLDAETEDVGGVEYYEDL